jgi:protein-tyrosine phosphatase
MPSHADRVLTLAGTSNFRDLGGYRGRDGRSVRWRRLFRSAHLGGLSEPDLAALAALGIARTVDFRGEVERAGMPCVLPGVTQHSLAIEPTGVQRIEELAGVGSTLDAATMTGLMQDLYRGLIADQAHRFAELFELLLQFDAPLVVHCTAGKDRTGVAVALILLSLGVSRELVMQDYLLSNDHFRRPVAATGSTIPAEALAVLWHVQQAFLDTALRAVDDDHGGIERYLEHRLGLSTAARDALAARYLQSS